MRDTSTPVYEGNTARQVEFKVRDRDSPVTKEGLIFRVYGYDHPPCSCVCDVEYAPEQIYKTDDPRAIRQSPSQRYYKFYVDGGLKFVSKNYPGYQLFFTPLNRKLVGLTSDQIVELRKPEEKLSDLLERDLSREDKLMSSLQQVLDIVTDHSKLHSSDFGVFGSILHDFYNPDFSDLDFIVYGRSNLKVLRETLKDLYRTENLRLANEFDDSAKWAKNRHWFFKDMTISEFCEFCKNKLIYGIYKPITYGRDFKVEFEPVKDWSEIHDEYDPNSRIRKVGWISAIAEVLDDSDSFFTPSVYAIEPKKIIKGPGSYSIDRIVSFVEEFRGQARVGQEVIVKGNLEEIEDSKGKHYQIVLTRAPDYYKQVLKPSHSSSAP
jgi:predicted nucleotidyltransferase